MFDEISSQPSLQHALTDLHVLDSNSRGKTFHFKVDTGACGNLFYHIISTNRLQEARPR